MNRRDKQLLVVVAVDDFADVFGFERFAYVVVNQVDCLNNLDIAEVLADVGCEGVERIARAGYLDAVAVVVVVQAQFAVVDIGVDILVSVALYDLFKFVERGGTIKRNPAQNADNASGVFRRRVSQIMRD